MYWEWFYPPGLYIISGIVALAGARTTWRNEKRNPGAETLAIMLVLAAEWVFGLALGTISTTYSTKIFWINIHFIGVAFAGTAWFVSINQYIQGNQWLTHRKLILLLTVPALTVLLAFTNQSHGLIYKEIFLVPHGPYEITTTTYGVALWVFLIYNGVLIIGGSLILIATLGQSWWTFRVNGSIMLMSTLTPVITLLLQVFRLDIFGPLRPTSLAIIFSGITAAYGLESARRQQIVSVSRHEVFDTIEDIIFVTDIQNRIIDMNKHAESFSGETLAESIGQPIEKFFPQFRQIDLNKGNTTRITVEQQDSARIYDCDVGNMSNWEGKPVNTLYILRDTTKRAAMEQRVISSLQEKETLLREIHHRAKNNLQVISSIFNLQSNLIESENLREAFQESQERIQAIALVHEKLYQSEGVNYIDYSEYLHTLIDRLMRPKVIANSTIAFEMHVEGISIPYDLATPCGLIAYELISNALQHAFPNRNNGTVRIICRVRQDNQLLIKIGDDGVGMPGNLDIYTCNTLGFQLITALVYQIQGHLRVDQRLGTSIEIVFPLEQNSV